MGLIPTQSMVLRENVAAMQGEDGVDGPVAPRTRHICDHRSQVRHVATSSSGDSPGWDIGQMPSYFPHACHADRLQLLPFLLLYYHALRMRSSPSAPTTSVETPRALMILCSHQARCGGTTSEQTAHNTDCDRSARNIFASALRRCVDTYLIFFVF